MFIVKGFVDLTVQSVLSGTGNPLRNLCRMLSGTVATVLFRVVRGFSRDVFSLH